MKVINYLKGIAKKAGLIKILEEFQKKKPEPFETRTVSLKQLEEEFRKARPPKLHKNAPELFIGFDKIFQSLNLPENEWNAEKVLKLLNTQKYKLMGKKKACLTIRNLFSLGGFPVDEFIRDAAARDNALDSYEKFAYNQLKKRTEERLKQIEDYRQEIETLKLVQAKDEKAFKNWKKKKLEKEKELLEGVSCITSWKGITVD